MLTLAQPRGFPTFIFITTMPPFVGADGTPWTTARCDLDNDEHNAAPALIIDWCRSQFESSFHPMGLTYFYTNLTDEVLSSHTVIMAYAPYQENSWRLQDSERRGYIRVMFKNEDDYALFMLVFERSYF